MTMRKPTLFLAAAMALLALGILVRWSTKVRAADHAEAPGTTADAPADIADFYAWHDSTAGKLIAVLTFAGLDTPATGQEGTFDANVLYTVHIDQDGDDVSDIDIWVRFGQNSEGQWGVQVENLPGATGTVTGAVNTNIAIGSGLQVFAGLRDDPFFFDFDGFNTTLATDTLSFDNTRDSFAGLNVTAIVLEMDLATVTMSGSFTSVQLWATTARK